MFREFDPNGNGFLSLAEVDRGVREVLNIGELFDAKPAIIRAFNMAKDVGAATTKHSDDYVTIIEFRLLLV